MCARGTLSAPTPRKNAPRMAQDASPGGSWYNAITLFTCFPPRYDPAIPARRRSMGAVGAEITAGAGLPNSRRCVRVMDNQTTAQVLEPLMENGRAAGGSPLEAGHYIRGFIIPALRVRSTSGATCQAQQQCGLVAPEAGSLRSRSLIKPAYVKPPARPAPEHCVPQGSFHSSCLGPPAPCLSWGGLRASASRRHLGGGVGVDQKITLRVCRAIAAPGTRPPKRGPTPTTKPAPSPGPCVPRGRSRGSPPPEGGSSPDNKPPHTPVCVCPQRSQARPRALPAYPPVVP